LRTNSPVNVIVESGQLAQSVVIPRESATRNSNGEWIVWQKVGAERFVSRQVNMQPLSGDEIIINLGLSPGNLIVTSGANLLGNIR
jgi:hypothetical protein